MKKLDQTRKTDCMRACFAMILGLKRTRDLQYVEPQDGDWCGNSDPWLLEWQQVLEPYGYRLQVLTDDFATKEGEAWVAIVQSRKSRYRSTNKLLHAVVMLDHKLFYDPAPNWKRKRAPRYILGAIRLVPLA